MRVERILDSCDIKGVAVLALGLCVVWTGIVALQNYAKYGIR